MKSARFFLCSSFALLGLSGCGVDSIITKQPVSVPADWKNAHHFPVASPTQDLSRWWSRFDDPTLTHLISNALKNSPDMASASARIKESRAQRNATRASLFPSLSGSASTNANTSDRDVSGRNSDTSYSAGLNASWEVDLFGKTRSSVEAASAQLGASEENFNSVQASLASEIAIAYTNLRANEAALEVLFSNVKTREETSQLASWRTQAGEADSLESSQALSSLEQARASIPALQQNISQSRNLLALLSGQAPGSLDGTLSSGKKAIPNPPRSLAVGIPVDTLRQRPDVRIAGYQLLAAAASTRAADAERYPSLNLAGSLGLNTLASSKLFNPETATAGIIAGISSPIFDAGRIRSNIEAQSAAEEQTYQAYRSTVLTALSEVEDSLIACRRTAERLDTLEKATAAAREADEIARQRYQTGEIDFVSVLDAQRSLLGLESNLFSVRADRTIAYIQLYKALGGGWSAGS
ncbi:MAG: efflux transporter outer membrane subunit [Luteolibacter sp.]|uniref:efflux transporter outer membrane subunit n=1 Tax=Luteolibacter sp. TaxID=1962973 RepID=UPI003267115F